MPPMMPKLHICRCEKLRRNCLHKSCTLGNMQTQAWNALLVSCSGSSLASFCFSSTQTKCSRRTALTRSHHYAARQLLYHQAALQLLRGHDLQRSLHFRNSEFIANVVAVLFRTKNCFVRIALGTALGLQWYLFVRHCLSQTFSSAFE